jgi:hypothetical protein
MRKMFIVALSLGLALTACSKKKLTVDAPKGKTIEPGEVRDPVWNFSLSPAFEAELQNKGIYTPDICIRLVKIAKSSADSSTYLEIASVTCPTTGDLAENDVLLRLKVEPQGTSETDLRVVYESPSYHPEIGAIKKTVSGNVTSYSLESLCDIDAGNSGWDTYCNVAIENSVFRNPEPFDFYNLD